MFNAICSRLPGEITITADEAYRKVWKSDDWGFTQAREGWRCPECRQPVFLKGPHERTGKMYSFVVHAHFCHHSAAAAANCAMYRASGARGKSQSEQINDDRKQSLRRFFQGVDDMADYVALLLRAEEDLVRLAARDAGVKRSHLTYLATDAQSAEEHVGLGAAQIHVQLNRFDGFLAGVAVLGVDKNPSIRNGFKAVSGPKNRLRSLFVEFGRNRKRYFDILAETGLFDEHDRTVSILMSQAVTEIEAARQEQTPTYHGAIISVLESILAKLSLSCNHDLLASYLVYLQSFPVLGQRLQVFRPVRLGNEDFLINDGFKPLNQDIFPSIIALTRSEVVSQASSGSTIAPPIRSIKPHTRRELVRQVSSVATIPPPVRITGSRRLLVESRVIEQLASEGSKLNGKSTFIRPGATGASNFYVVIPGNGCLLLTSSIHSDTFKQEAERSLSPDIVDGDSELPEMIWEARIQIPSDREMTQGVFIDKDELYELLESTKRSFQGWAGWKKGGLRYRRVSSGLRISMTKHPAD